MEFTCGQCKGTGTYADITCSLCGGDGKIELTDQNMANLTEATKSKLHGMVWADMITKIADIEDKVNDVMAKCEEIYDNLPGHWH